MLFGYDVAWGLIRAFIILSWFIGTGLVAVFLLKFKPTRKIIDRYFDLF